MHRLKTCLAAIVMLLPAIALNAQTAEPDLGKVVQIKLIDGWLMANGNRMGALEVTLAPGWKTYWRTAGETGIPPKFDWGKSSNLKAVRLHWPRPDVILSYGVKILGYKNELVLPIEYTPIDRSQVIKARAELALGVCKEVCIPVNVPLAAMVGTKTRERNFLIELALEDQPTPGNRAGITSAVCKLEKTADGFALSGRFVLPPDGPEAEVVVFELPQKDVWVAPSSSRRTGDVLSAQTSLVSLSGGAFQPDAAQLRITIIGKNRAVDLTGCAQG